MKMNIYHKKIYLLLAVFLAVFMLSGCDNSKNNAEVKNQTNEQAEVKQDAPKESEPKKEDTKSTAERTPEDQKTLTYTDRNNLIKQELINKYQAVDLSGIRPKYSLELSKKIQDNKVILSGKIQDVYLRENKYFVRIEPRRGAFNYISELECSKDFADYVIKNKSIRDFFAITEINEVSKPSFEISASPISEEEAVIKLDSGEYLFIFKGKLIDFRFGEERLP